MYLVSKETPEGPINGKLSQDGKHIIVGTNENGLSVVEKIAVDIEDIKDLAKGAVALYQEVRYFFLDLFNNLPSVIKQDGKSYRRNELPAPGSAEDVILYRCTEDANDILFKSTGRNMTKAKDDMFYQLQDANLIF